VGRWVRTWGALAATLVATMMVATPASADLFIFNAGPGGNLNGFTVSASGTMGCASSPYCAASDTGLGEKGIVVGGGPYADCNFTFHYHGELFGQPDPAPNGCGWGPLMEYAPAQKEIQLVSDAITYEARAGEAKTPKQARELLAASVLSLGGLPDNGFVEDAEDLDHDAFKALKAKKYKKFGKKLRKAVLAKQAYFDSFFQPQLR